MYSLLRVDPRRALLPKHSPFAGGILYQHSTLGELLFYLRDNSSPFLP
jgi:hypothetical protein